MEYVFLRTYALVTLTVTAGVIAFDSRPHGVTSQERQDFCDYLGDNPCPENLLLGELCATNAVTYDNECQMRRDNCKRRENQYVAMYVYGPCPATYCPNHCRGEGINYVCGQFFNDFNQMKFKKFRNYCKFREGQCRFRNVYNKELTLVYYVNDQCTDVPPPPQIETGEVESAEEEERDKQPATQVNEEEEVEEHEQPQPTDKPNSQLDEEVIKTLEVPTERTDMPERQKEIEDSEDVESNEYSSLEKPEPRELPKYKVTENPSTKIELTQPPMVDKHEPKTAKYLLPAPFVDQTTEEVPKEQIKESFSEEEDVEEHEPEPFEEPEATEVPEESEPAEESEGPGPAEEPMPTEETEEPEPAIDQEKTEASEGSTPTTKLEQPEPAEEPDISEKLDEPTPTEELDKPDPAEELESAEESGEATPNDELEKSESAEEPEESEPTNRPEEPDPSEAQKPQEGAATEKQEEPVTPKGTMEPKYTEGTVSPIHGAAATTVAEPNLATTRTIAITKAPALGKTTVLPQARTTTVSVGPPKPAAGASGVQPGVADEGVVCVGKCDKEIALVCASDGLTYLSPCLLAFTACLLRDTSLVVSQHGPCPP